METEFISTTSLKETRSILCEVCAYHKAKYTCPRCEVRTCSLRCNKIHKIEVECNGLRDQTKFIPLKKFTNLDLSSDFQLLETISRTVESSRKQFGRRNFTPNHLIKLREAAKQRQINLSFLPNNFVKRRKNTTKYDFKSKTILWHLDWVFINANNLTLTDIQQPESVKIASILEKYFLNNSPNDTQEKLKYYLAAGLAGVRLLLKAEQKKGLKFFEIDIHDTINESLTKKLVIEYPTVFVLLKDHIYNFNVIDSDSEDGDNIHAGQVVDRLIKKSESDESLHNSLKNLLFIEESDD